MSETPEGKTGFRSFSFEAKAAVVLFLFVGLMGTVYAGRGFFFDINRPFFEQRNYQGPQYLSLEEQAARDIESQRQRDTDEDGISDYDELHLYGTSPYLADTDSDGVDDATELTRGADPGCPEGVDCRRFADVEGQADTSSGLALGITTGADLNTLLSQGDQQDQIDALPVSELRAILLQTGLDPTLIDGLDDASVRSLFEQAVASAEASGVLDQLADAIEARDAATSQDSETSEPTP